MDRPTAPGPQRIEGSPLSKVAQPLWRDCSKQHSSYLGYLLLVYKSARTAKVTHFPFWDLYLLAKVTEEKMVIVARHQNRRAVTAARRNKGDVHSGLATAALVLATLKRG